MPKTKRRKVNKSNKLLEIYWLWILACVVLVLAVVIGNSGGIIKP